jgi:nitroreductase
MNASDCIKSRRSIRNYKEDQIPQDVINEVVELARFAPSWKNTQIARYYVVQSAELKKKIAEECMMDFAFNTKTLTKAPALVVVAYVEKRSGFERDGSFTTSKEDRWEMFDAGIATQTFCLAAAEKGLGTCIMGIFDEAKIAEAIALPEGQKVGAVLAIGYPEEEPVAPARKEVEQLVQFL